MDPIRSYSIPGHIFVYIVLIEEIFSIIINSNPRFDIDDCRIVNFHV